MRITDCRYFSYHRSVQVRSSGSALSQNNVLARVSRASPAGILLLGS